MAPCACYVRTLGLETTPVAAIVRSQNGALVHHWTSSCLRVFAVEQEGFSLQWACPLPVALLCCTSVSDEQVLVIETGYKCSLWRVSSSGIIRRGEECSLLAAPGCSAAAALGGPLTSCVQRGQLAVHAYADTLHCIKVEQGTTRVLAAAAMPCFGSMTAPEPGSTTAAINLQAAWQPFALAWLPQKLQQDALQRPLLAVLHQFTPPGGIPGVHVDTLVVDWSRGQLLPGPWACRLVHPTSRLLLELTGHPSLPDGLLLLSSTGVVLLTDPGAPPADYSGSSSPEAGPASSAAGPVEVVSWLLPGVPTCCCALPGKHRWVVGDDMAGLMLLDLSSSTFSCSSITTSSPPSAPSLLVTVALASTHPSPMDTDAAEGTGPTSSTVTNSSGSPGSSLLFLGSRSGSSQVLQVPPEAQLVRASSQAAAWPILQSAVLPSLAAASCGVGYRDPSGSWPEQQLLLGAGVSPRGRLVKVRTGMGLQPYMLDGPALPGGAAVFMVSSGAAVTPVRPAAAAGGEGVSAAAVRSAMGVSGPQGSSAAGGSVEQPHDELLVVSLESSQQTLVLSLGGHTLSQLELPGLETGAASLLVAGLPAGAGGGLVQATEAGVRRLGPGPEWQLLSSWAAPEPLSLAAASGHALVAASGERLYSFDIAGPDSSALTLQSQHQLPQQVSCLSLLQLPSSYSSSSPHPAAASSSQPGCAVDYHLPAEQQLLVACGLWVENRVQLLSWPQLVPVGSVELQGQQPRSSEVLEVAGRGVLLVGTATGQVLLWELIMHKPANSSAASSGSAVPAYSVGVRHGRCVQVTQSSITLKHLRLPLQHHPGSCLTPKRRAQQLQHCMWAQGEAGAVFWTDPDAAALLETTNASSTSTSTSSSGAHSLAVTDLVRVSRVCGSDGLVALSGVHTAAMPHSLAWVAASSRLCLGSLDTDHKLRWVVAPLADTVEQLVVHEPTGCVVVLTAASDGAQSLKVLEGGSLKQLLSIRFPRGHYYCSLACLELPCTSSQQPAAAAPMDSSSHGTTAQQQQQQQVLPTRPFLVLASYLLFTEQALRRQPQPHGDAPPHHKRFRQGVLTFFDLVKTAGSAAESAGPRHSSGGGTGSGGPGGGRTHIHYQLRHLGSCSLEPGYLPSCLAAAVPCWVDPSDLPASTPQAGTRPSAAQRQHSAAAAAGGGGVGAVGAQVAAAVEQEALQGSTPWLGWTLRLLGGAASRLPLLLVGGEAGVTAYHVWIDDQQQGQQQQQAGLLAAARQVPTSVEAPTPGASSSSSNLQGPQSSLGDSSSPASHCTLAVQPVARWVAPSSGCVTQLLVMGRYVVALEALAGASSAVLLCSPAGVQLVPVAAGPQHCITSAATYSRQQLAALSAAAGSPSSTSSWQGQPVDAGTQQEPAGAPAADDLQCLLTGLHPGGLQLLQLEETDLDQALAQGSAAAQQRQERGKAPRWYEALEPPAQELLAGDVLHPYLEDPENQDALLSTTVAGIRRQVEVQLQQHHLQQQSTAGPGSAAGGAQPGSQAGAAGGQLPWAPQVREVLGSLGSSLVDYFWAMEVLKARSNSSSSSSGGGGGGASSSGSRTAAELEWWAHLVQQMQAGLPFDTSPRPSRAGGDDDGPDPLVMHPAASADLPGAVTLTVPGRLGLHLHPLPDNPQQQQGSTAAAARGASTGQPSPGCGAHAATATPSANGGAALLQTGSVVCVTPAGRVVGAQLLPGALVDLLGEGPTGLQRRLRTWAKKHWAGTGAGAARRDGVQDNSMEVEQQPVGRAAHTAPATAGTTAADEDAASPNEACRCAAACEACWGWEDPAAVAARHLAASEGQQRLPSGRCVDGDLLQLLMPELLEQAGGLQNAVATPAELQSLVGVVLQLQQGLV